MGLELQPLTLEEANVFVDKWHRHSQPVVGHKFSIGLNDGEVVRGVAIVGRPVARGFQDGWTLEVLRCCTDGVPNGCSKLYGACWRAVSAMGFKRLVTYTWSVESGVSLRAAGFRVLHDVRGRHWGCRSRPRVDTLPLQDKLCWGIG